MFKTFMLMAILTHVQIFCVIGDIKIRDINSQFMSIHIEDFSVIGDVDLKSRLLCH